MQFLLFVTVAIYLGNSGQHDVKLTYEIPYRLLHSEMWKANEPSGTAFYAVSVPELLDRTELEKLICEIISKERPPNFYPRLHISIYHNLDEYIPPMGAPGLEAKLRNHALASYIWNVTLPEAQNRLIIDRDNRGNALNPPEGFNFDHMKACGQR
jgi:hypothetical protein